MDMGREEGREFFLNISADCLPPPPLPETCLRSQWRKERERKEREREREEYVRAVWLSTEKRLDGWRSRERGREGKREKPLMRKVPELNNSPGR